MEGKREKWRGGGVSAGGKWRGGWRRGGESSGWKVTPLPLFKVLTKC